MAYIIDGGRYSATEAKQMLRENFTPWLAIEFYDLNKPPVDVGVRKFDVSDAIRGLIAIGAIDEDMMFEQFITELLTLARTGKLRQYDLPYDIEDMDIRYVPDNGGASKNRAPARKGNGRSVPSKGCKPKAKSAASRNSKTNARRR